MKRNHDNEVCLYEVSYRDCRIVDYRIVDRTKCDVKAVSEEMKAQRESIHNRIFKIDNSYEVFTTFRDIHHSYPKRVVENTIVFIDLLERSGDEVR